VARVPTPAVLAVDAGSSSVRASLVDLAEGNVLSTGSVATPSCGPELDLEELWADLVGVVGELDRDAADLRAVAVAAQLGTVLADDRGRAVGPALLWGDQRAAADAERLAESLPSGAAGVVGRRMTAELPIAKVRRLAREEPAVLGRARWMLSLKDALVQRLTGRIATDETHASYSGLFDVRRRRWAADLAAAAKFDPHLLPPVWPATSQIGKVAEDAAAELGVAAGVPVALGGPDGTVGAVGAGAVRAGVTVDVAGTTDVLLHALDKPLMDPSARLVVNAHAAPGTWTAGGPTGLTGGAVEWTARLLRFASVGDAYTALGREIEALRPGSDGPLFLTALGGSRFPTWRSHESGLLARLRPSHGPAHIIRAAQEGAAFTVAEGLDALRQLGASLDEVVVVGGAAARPSTLQLRADAWNLPVVTVSNREATTIGVAMIAGVAGGVFADLEVAERVLVRRAARYEPDASSSVTLADARRLWRESADLHFGDG
jgi:xylulokinase